MIKIMDLNMEILSFVKQNPNAVTMDKIVDRFNDKCPNALIVKQVHAMVGQELTKTDMGYKPNWSFLHGEVALPEIKTGKKHTKDGALVTKGVFKSDPSVMEREKAFWKPVFSPAPQGGMRVYKLAADGTYRDEKGRPMDGGIHEMNSFDKAKEEARARGPVKI